MTPDDIRDAYDLLQDLELLRSSQRRNNEHILDCRDLWAKEHLTNEAVARIRDAINRELDAAIGAVASRLAVLGVSESTTLPHLGEAHAVN